MPTSVARFIVRRRLVLVGAILFMAIAGTIGGSVAGKLSSGGFDDPSSESSVTKRLIEQTFGTGAPNLVLLVRSNSGSAEMSAEHRLVNEDSSN